ncbi:hypothetical protein ACLB2K_010684 [Fragaria x ananassa]
MASSLKSATGFLHLKNPQTPLLFRSPAQKSSLSFKKLTPMASLTTANTTVGLAKTFIKLKEQGKRCASVQVALIPYITAGDPDLSVTAEALKVLDSCGSDIIELGVPYSDPLADGPVIQAAATRALARGTNLNAILAMLKEVIPKLSCPIALFTYYNPIMKRGVGEFISTIQDVGVHGLVVPDVPLEETAILRKEALKNNIELVLLTTPTTPMERMKAIAETSEGFLYLVSSIGVTGARASVNERVPALLREIKEATSKPVAVGFGISKPEQAKQVAGWGADGVIVGSAIVKILGDANTPEEGLKELEIFTKSLKSALL